jgi:transcriptional regulator with XRE-family HTH domain
MSATWSGPRIAAAIARLKDTGMNESQIARTAGVGRSTVNRWARGANRPDHDPIRRLADAAFRRHPDTARELVEASGYAWAEPVEAPGPPPVPPDVLAVIQEHYPDRQDEILRMLERFSGHDEATGDGEGRSPSAGDGGTRHAG